MDKKSDSELSVPQVDLKSEIQPGRNKVALRPGHSLMDWIRLTHSNKDLTGVGGKLLNITPEELAKHNKKDDAWISLKGKVYNVTAYMDFHPGGQDELMRGVGKDATVLFNEVHRWVNAESMLQKCLVGRLKVPAVILNKGLFSSLGKKLIANVNTSPAKAVSVNKTDTCYHSCKLISKETINHNTKLFVFSLPDPTTMLVPLGCHVHIHAVLNGVDVVRSYTPVIPSLDIPKDHSSLTEGRRLYFMIKVYPDGALSSFINQIDVGGTVEISSYEGNFEKSSLECGKLILLAAGTGLTPMVKLIHFALHDASRERIIHLVFFNRKEKDILWHAQLDKLADANERFQVTYVLSEPDSGWRGLTGRVSKSLLENFLPQSDDNVLICICGPTPFTKSCVQYLEEMEYSASCIQAFLG